jgi:hypothetical protein
LGKMLYQLFYEVWGEKSKNCFNSVFKRNSF